MALTTVLVVVLVGYQVREGLAVPHYVYQDIPDPTMQLSEKRISELFGRWMGNVGPTEEIISPDLIYEEKRSGFQRNCPLCTVDLKKDRDMGKFGSHFNILSCKPTMKNIVCEPVKNKKTIYYPVGADSNGTLYRMKTIIQENISEYCEASVKVKVEELKNTNDIEVCEEGIRTWKLVRS